MSKQSKAKAKLRKGRYAKPSPPRIIGANDNHPAAVNDNAAPVTIRGVRLTEGQQARFAIADEKLRDRSLEIRRHGHRIMEALDREIDARLQADGAARDLEELRGLEALRGLEIGVSKQQGTAGAPRASRDGLETLFTNQSISSVQHSAGLRYRADYELLDPEKGLTPPSIDQTRKIVRGGDGFAQKRREREEFVRDLEAMIQEEDRSFRGALGRTEVERVGRAVWALRAVAGKGENLLALSGSGSVQKRISNALIVALDCAAIAYGLE
ncbi:hypothetical protein [Brevundimonas vesicularis]|uniref:Uncharacterized protein n=1 Tax=Brevundimonas vesicularis TaxID=41276 RepID=A0ABU4KNW4_BREVE|nr:hypothetical protein [Brevundimonas vesicularis]MDX2334595.1 hypothetical protein [Brevundimonas vesicularis]